MYIHRIGLVLFACQSTDSPGDPAGRREQFHALNLEQGSSDGSAVIEVERWWRSAVEG
jgi:hypothetical protein